MQGTYCGGWRRCACLDAKTRVLAIRALASTTCNNFIADLLFLSEVSHSLVVAAGLRLRLRLLRAGLRPAGLVGLGPGPLRRSTRFWGWPAAQTKGRKQSKRIGD